MFKPVILLAKWACFMMTREGTKGFQSLKGQLLCMWTKGMHPFHSRPPSVINNKMHVWISIVPSQVVSMPWFIVGVHRMNFVFLFWSGVKKYWSTQTCNGEKICSPVYLMGRCFLRSRTFFSFSTISSMLRSPLWHTLFSIWVSQSQNSLFLSLKMFQALRRSAISCLRNDTYEGSKW